MNLNTNKLKKTITNLVTNVDEVKEELIKGIEAHTEEVEDIAKGITKSIDDLDNNIDKVKKKLQESHKECREVVGEIANIIKKPGEEVKAVIEDFQTRSELSKSVISAYQDFETEYKNGALHNFSSKFENALNVYLEKNPEAESNFISKIESHLSSLPLPKGMDANKAAEFRYDLAKLGLETLRVELKVFNINQETKSLKKINQLNDKLLADKILNYAEDLKKNVAQNKANHEAVKKVLSDNSLESLEKSAKLINPNAKNYNENLNQEIEDFLNGGDLKL